VAPEGRSRPPAMHFRIIRTFSLKTRNLFCGFICWVWAAWFVVCGVWVVCCLLGMGGLLLFVGYGRFRNLYQKVRIFFLAPFVGYGGPGLYPLFHKRLIAKLFGEYLSFFQFPFILVARLK